MKKIIVILALIGTLALACKKESAQAPSNKKPNKDCNCGTIESIDRRSDQFGVKYCHSWKVKNLCSGNVREFHREWWPNVCQDLSDYIVYFPGQKWCPEGDRRTQTKVGPDYTW